MAYNVSDSYKLSIDSKVRDTFITGKLKVSDTQIIDIENDLILTGSLYITNQCVSSDSFAYGAVFASECGFTLKTSIDRYTLYNKEVELQFNIKNSDGTTEQVPLGKYYINEPARIGKDISIKAYDGMIFFETSLLESTVGTPYELLSFICTNIGIELANSEKEIQGLVNGSAVLTMSPDRISTYRDALSAICKTLCSFAVIDRTGKLKICQYATDVSKTVNAKIRTSSKMFDFTTYHTSISAKFLESGIYKTYGQSEQGSGLLYELGEVPVVEGTDTSNQEVLDNIFNELLKINYVPCDFSFIGDPSIDLGDKIECVDRDGFSTVSYVTFYKWVYRGSHQIKSAGGNPKLIYAKEKRQNDTSQLESAISKKTLTIYTYTNAKFMTFSGGSTVRDMEQVVRIAFATADESTPILVATIPFEVDCDGYVEFETYIDGVYFEGSRLAQYCLKGKHFVTISNYIPSKKSRQCRLEILAKTYVNEGSEIRELQSQVNNTPISTTVPTCTIDKFSIRAVLLGQGLAGKVKWDGMLLFTDSIERMPINNTSVTMLPCSDILGIEVRGPVESPLSETIQRMPINTVTITMRENIVDNVSILKNQ